MSTVDMLKQNWRVVLLVVLLLASGFALFAPSGDAADASAPANATDGEQRAAAAGMTNLQYGLELSGGTRVRAPLVGMTAENVAFEDRSAVEQEVAANLDGVDRVDVRARPAAQGQGTVELFTDNVTEEAFVAALGEAGVDATVDDVRSGVTEQTRQTAVQVLQSKVDESGLSGGTVQQTQTGGGDHFILVEVPNENRSSVLELIEDRGVVQVTAGYPTENGSYEEQAILTQGDFASVGPPENPEGEPPGVSVVLTDEAANEFVTAMETNGFTGEGVDQCRYPADTEDPGYCLYTVVDDDKVYGASMSPNLAQTIRQGDFENQPSFRMTTTNMTDARQLRVHLQAGSLPAPLDIQDRGTTFYLEPSLAEDFKVFSFITGLIAALAVSLTIYVRYRDVRVAAPMLLTALAEVAILLGFAAAIRLPLDLSHIAGFIAVIGTGVDDLVIIADEVLAQGEVRTDRVFKNRFRKALWVIGAAAATTIIAMSPLAIMSLGDLRGFAIITIIGVLIGVLLTRPAYGDILRALMTRD